MALLALLYQMAFQYLVDSHYSLLILTLQPDLVIYFKSHHQPAHLLSGVLVGRHHKYFSFSHAWACFRLWFLFQHQYSPDRKYQPTFRVLFSVTPFFDRSPLTPFNEPNQMVPSWLPHPLVLANLCSVK